MKELRLTYEEGQQLERKGIVVVERRGLTIFIESTFVVNGTFSTEPRDLKITVVCPYEKIRIGDNVKNLW